MKDTAAWLAVRLMKGFADFRFRIPTNTSSQGPNLLLSTGWPAASLQLGLVTRNDFAAHQKRRRRMP